MVTSRMAVMQLPLAAAYGASKRAMVAYADALRLELATHVSVTCVYPSAVQSPIHDSTKSAGLSLEGMSTYEPVGGVVDAILTAALAKAARRDVTTTRKGAVEFFLARHLPVLTDAIVRLGLAWRETLAELLTGIRAASVPGCEVGGPPAARRDLLTAPNPWSCGVGAGGLTR